MSDIELIEPKIERNECTGMWEPVEQCYATNIISGPNSISGIMERAEALCNARNKAASKARYGIGFSEPVISWDGHNTLYVLTNDKVEGADK